MAKIIDLPDGTEAEFPDDMPDNEIEAVLKTQYKPRSAAPVVDVEEEKRKYLDEMLGNMSFPEKAWIGLGKTGNDIAVGAEQLYQDSPLGDPERARALRDMVGANRPADEALTSTAGGLVGNTLGYAGITAPIAAVGGVPAAIMAGLGLGALQPNTGSEDRAQHMHENAAINAVIPVGGEAGRKILGVTDPARRAMVDTLRKAGVVVPKSREFVSMLDDAANYLLARSPFTRRSVHNEGMARESKVADAVWDMVGGTAPKTGAEYGEQAIKAEQRVVSALPKSKVSLQTKTPNYAANLVKRQIGKQREGIISTTTKEIADQVDNLFAKKLDAQALYRTRKDILGELGRTTKEADKEALSKMLVQVERGMESGLSAAEKKELRIALANSRAIGIFRNAVSDAGGGTNINIARNAMDEAGKSGFPPRQDVMDVLSAGNKIMGHRGMGDPEGGILYKSLLSLSTPTALGMRGISNLSNAAGIPNALNNPYARKVATMLLRGGGLSATGD